jgi:hypothetical protein
MRHTGAPERNSKIQFCYHFRPQIFVLIPHDPSAHHARSASNKRNDPETSSTRPGVEIQILKLKNDSFIRSRVDLIIWLSFSDRGVNFAKRCAQGFGVNLAAEPANNPTAPIDQVDVCDVSFVAEIFRPLDGIAESIKSITGAYCINDFDLHYHSANLARTDVGPSNKSTINNPSWQGSCEPQSQRFAAAPRTLKSDARARALVRTLSELTDVARRNLN